VAEARRRQLFLSWANEMGKGIRHFRTDFRGSLAGGRGRPLSLNGGRFPGGGGLGEVGEVGGGLFPLAGLGLSGLSGLAAEWDGC